MRTQQYLIVFLCTLATLLTACGGGEDGSLTVTSTVPTHRQGDVSVSEKIQIKFNQDVNTDSLSSSSIVLHNMNSHKPVRATIKYDETTRTITLSPSILEYENHYVLSVTNFVTSKGGKSIEETLDVSFTTEFEPPLFLQEPANGETKVNTRASIRVSFDKPISPSTINQNNFYVLDNIGNKINGTVTLIDDTALFDPSTELTVNTQYKVVLTTSIIGTDGFPISSNNIEWSFTTAIVRSSTLHVAGPGDDTTNYIDIDTQGSVIIAGSTDGQLGNTPNVGNHDAYIAKYDTLHNQQWITQFGTPEFDAATHITIDNLNNIYVLGYTDGSIDGLTQTTGTDVFVSKIATSGITQWTTQISASKDHNMSYGIVLMDNNVFIAGATSASMRDEHDFFIAKLDAQSGAQIWLNETESATDQRAIGLTSDASGNLLLAYKSTEPPEKDIAPVGKTTIKLHAYNITGTNALLMWEKELGSGDHEYNHINMTSTATGTYLSGERFPAFRGFEPPPPDAFENSGVFVTKIDPASNGAVISDKIYPVRESSQSETIVVDELDNVYMAGFVFGLPGFFGDPFQAPPQEEMQNISVIKFNSNAEEQWSASIPATHHAGIKHMVIDNQGSLHLAGETHGNVDGNSLLGGQDGFIAKLSTADGSVQ